jgi:DNA-directed RNA polymerase subunit RPC12/RpoP
MDDLISRAAAIAKVEKARKAARTLTGMDFVMMLKDQPAMDAAPVVHGRWVKVSGYVTPGGDPVWKCSECGKGVHVYGIEHGTYGADIADGQWISCPNCGARMDGERRDDDAVSGR